MSFTQVFVICESSQIVGDRFNEIDFYSQCDWYKYPNHIQRLLPVLIINTTQQPIYIKGFGNFLCNRETFRSVVNGGFSYFTLLRQVEQWTQWVILGILQQFDDWWLLLFYLIAKYYFEKYIRSFFTQNCRSFEVVGKFFLQ